MPRVARGRSSSGGGPPMTAAQSHAHAQPAAPACWLALGALAAASLLATVAQPSLPALLSPLLAVRVPLLLVLLLLAAAGALAAAVLRGTAGVSGDSASGLSAAASLSLIQRRRSMFPKDFTGDSSGITQDKLEQLLEAARWAPSHKLTEPWRFVVMGGASKAAFEELTIEQCQALLPADMADATVARLRRKQAKDWPNVACYIAICMQRHEEVPEWEEVAAVAAAVQNLWLQATALGIAGYWSSWHAVARDSPAMLQLLGLDAAAGDRCLGVFVVGEADADRAAGYRGRRQALAGKVDWRLA